jgi:hypothetical protein
MAMAMASDSETLRALFLEIGQDSEIMAWGDRNPEIERYSSTVGAV